MSERVTCVSGGRLVRTSGVSSGDLWISGEKFVDPAGLSDEQRRSAERVDAAGQLVLPGSIDPQVHFREPGNEHKEDLASGSRAAIAGGVTTFFEMPNTKPATTNREAVEDKFRRAAGRTFADHAFFVGATAENADELGELELLSGCAGVKVFMGSSTGNLLIPDDETLERVLRSGTRRVTVHSEDEHLLERNYKALGRNEPVTRHPEVRSVEAAVRSTTRLLDLAEKTGRPVHVLHVSTGDEVDLMAERDLGDLVTFELTPNHLFLAAPDCYEQHGSFAQMNPPVRDAGHQARLRRAAAEREAACVGSDHAPHTAEEKARPYPQAPSGIPGVQTTLGLFLTAVRDGWLQLEDLPRLLHDGPIRVYGLLGKDAFAHGADADLTLVDPTVTAPLPDEWLLSRARTNPFVGRPLAGWPSVVYLRGERAFANGETVGEPRGRPLRFADVPEA